MQRTSSISPPKLLQGNYLSLVKLLLSPEWLPLLRAQILWVDYRTIPLPIFLQALHVAKKAQLVNSLFFLQIPRFETYHILFATKRLHAAANLGFKTMIIHLPKYIRNFSNEAFMGLNYLCTRMQVFFLAESDLRGSRIHSDITVVEVKSDVEDHEFA
ncbi:MAG: hypothetical protein ACFFE8_10360 [Candidatus Heimdallarchaeota archaeon]